MTATATATAVVASTLALGLAVPVGVIALLPRDPRGRRRIRENLDRGVPAARQQEEEHASALARAAVRLTPAGNRRLLEQLHARAGRPEAWTLERIALVKVAVPALTVVLGGLLVLASPSAVMMTLIALVAVVGFFVPDLLLYSRGIERQQAIALALPDTLDQMLIGVEAGLGFDSAIARAGLNGKGPLADELVRTLQDMRLGLSRRAAYRALAERTTVPELRAFVRAVIQADTYGIAMSSVLRTQAKEMRLRRRQRAEEKALQIPVKVLFPLMLFILPVLMIAVLGPTVIRAVEQFG